MCRALRSQDIGLRSSSRTAARTDALGLPLAAVLDPIGSSIIVSTMSMKTVFTMAMK